MDYLLPRLIVLAASVAVVGSMVILALFDWVFVAGTSVAVEFPGRIESVELNEPSPDLRADARAVNNNVEPFKGTA
jgi:hypothetical protein